MNGMFQLTAIYEGQTEPQAVYSANENLLRAFGRDHHSAAKITPELTLYDPQGKIIATMDEWASNWSDQEETAK